MKRIFSLSMSVLLILFLTACSGFKSEPETTLSTIGSSLQYESSKSEGSTTNSTPTTYSSTTATKPSATQNIKTSETTSEVLMSSTAQKTETNVEETTESSSITCYVTIDCTKIQENFEELNKSKRSFVPSNGYILKDAAVELKENESAFDALKKACAEYSCTDNCKYCQKDGIQLEYSYTPAYHSYYVEGIHQLYEKDCGDLSGWLFCVNDALAESASSSYYPQNGDKIMFTYTVSMDF